MARYLHKQPTSLHALAFKSDDARAKPSNDEFRALSGTNSPTYYWGGGGGGA